MNKAAYLGCGDRQTGQVQLNEGRLAHNWTCPGFGSRHPPVDQSWTYDEAGRWDRYEDGVATFERDAQTGRMFASEGPTNVVFENNEPGGVARVSRADAWNRLVQTQRRTLLKNELRGLQWYEYDALGRMIRTNFGDTAVAKFGSGGEGSQWTAFYHSAAWQNLVELHSDGGDAKEVRQNIWSPAYVDALVMQERRTLVDSMFGDPERIYVVQDANYNVVGLVQKNSQNQWKTTDRFYYTPYGQAAAFRVAGAANPLTGASGVWASADWNYFHQGGYINARFDGLYHFRHRSYNPYIGQWMQRDPAGFVDGLNLHEYVGSNPVSRVDPQGLEAMMPAQLYDSAYHSVSDSDPSIRAGRATGDWLSERGKDIGAFFEYGFAGGDVGAAYWGGFGYGARGGGSIAVNTFTFGYSDEWGWTQSYQYQGPEFTASRILATISREALLAAVTAGAAQIGRGGIQGTGWIARAMRSASYSPTLLRGSQLISRGLAVYDVASGSYEVGQGLWAGFAEGNWADAGLHFLGGGLRVAGGLYSAREMSFWRAPQFARGRAIEAALGGNLPYAFETIDRFLLRTGVATSIKSTADIAGQLSKLRGHLRKLAAFTHDRRYPAMVTADMIRHRQFVLAIPRGILPSTQTQALAKLRQLSQRLNIDFVVRRIS